MIFWKIRLKQSTSRKWKTMRVFGLNGVEVRWSWRVFPEDESGTSQVGNVLQEELETSKSQRDRKDRQRRNVVEGAQKESAYLALKYTSRYSFNLASNTHKNFILNLVDFGHLSPENSRTNDWSGDWEHANIHLKLIRQIVKAHDDVVSDRITADVHLENARWHAVTV